MNSIEEIRKEIQNYFNDSGLVEGSERVIFSPNKTYLLESKVYKQTKEGCNWKVSKIHLTNNTTGEKLRTFYVNRDCYYYEWIEKEGQKYLLCAEDMYGGQTVIHLSSNEMASYSPGEDGFISTSYLLSPLSDKLAVVGCVWACPYEVRVYDFSNPMKLPLKELAVFDIDEYDDRELIWLDNNKLLIKDYQGNKIILNLIKEEWYKLSYRT